MLKLFIFGNHLVNIETISDHLSRVLKLPLFISEQFRIENQFTVSQIKSLIKQKIETENLHNYFIFLCNSYNIDFISELFNELPFDKIITIDSEKSGNSNLELQICTNCGNINSFFQPDYEEKSRCMICGSSYYKTAEEDTAIANKLKNYHDCKNFISSKTDHNKYINFDFISISETVNEIVKYLIYT